MFKKFNYKSLQDLKKDIESQRTHTIIMITAVMAFIMLALSACGREQDNQEESRTRTLSFYSSSLHIGVAMQAARDMNASWRERGYPYEFVLDLDFFPYTDWEGADDRYTRFMVQLMAGQGPDVLIFDRGFDINALARSGFLMDFNRLINNCLRTTREDFFTRPLEAFEMHGGLYMFPTNFDFNYVTINTSLPQSIIDSFTRHELITVEQMMGIYLQLMDNYAHEFGHMHLGLSNALRGGAGAQSIVGHTMGYFIDFDTRTSDLTNPGFVSFMDTYFRVGEGGGILGFGGWMSRAVQLEFVDSYVFIIHSNRHGQAQNHFTPYAPVFCHPKLLVNNEGKLITDSPLGQSIMASIGVTAAGNSDLAWEFIQYLIRVYTTGVEGSFGLTFGPTYFGSPIMRALFEDHSIRAFHRFLDAETGISTLTFGQHSRYLNPDWNRNSELYVGMSDPEERISQIDAAIQRIAMYNEMPMAMLFSTVPARLFEDNLDLFMRGAITTQDFTQRTQNAVSLWLIE